jgi:hypothetical protein
LPILENQIGLFRLCDLYSLCISEEECNNNTCKRKEGYAKIALLMLYPFQTLMDIQQEESYWKVFVEKLRLFKNNGDTVLWKKGV